MKYLQISQMIETNMPLPALGSEDRTASDKRKKWKGGIHMARKTDEQKMAQLQNQKKTIKARMDDKNRKARTHRLIEIGAEVEAALGITLDTPEARKALGDFLRLQEARGKWATKALAEATAPQNSEK